MTRRRVLALCLAAVFVLVGVFAAGRLTAPQSGTPGNASVEAGFARDMQTHHEQAVAMAMTVRDLTDDPEIRLLAYDIATTQANQSGQLYGLLNEWHLPQAPPEPSMTWMTRATLAGESHEHTAGPTTAAHTPGGPMPGYATQEQLTELAGLRGTEAEKYFLQLMIAHHRGGLEMAEAILSRTTVPQVIAIANGVITSQTSDIDVMQKMLDARS
jgi:uncharacterized protein (DUF305 family)